MRGGDWRAGTLTNRGFTGHEHVDEMDLIHMNGRVYDPTLGRFLSADPTMQSPYSSQGFNRYSYVHNNPLKYTDPSGYWSSGGVSGDSWAGDGWSDAGSTGGGWVDGSGDPITDGSGDPIGSVDYGGGGNVCSGSSCSNKYLAPGILGHWVPDGIVNGKQWCACVANDPTSHPIYTNSNRLGMSMPGVYPGPSSAAGLENVPWSDSTGSGGGGPLSQSTGIHSTVKDLSQNLAVNLVFDAESVYASYNAFNNGRTVEGIAYLGLGIIGTVNPFGKAGKAYKLGKLAFGRVFRATKRGDDWAKLSGQLRDAAKGKGNFGIGSGTREQADAMGKAWVGNGYKTASDGKTLVSKDGMRQFRPPSYKPRLDKTQANFEQRFPGQKSNRWQSNGHLDITD